MVSTKNLIRVAALAVTLSAAPLAFGHADGSIVRVNDALCQTETGTCCTETRSICNAGGADNPDKYYKASGPCGG